MLADKIKTALKTAEYMIVTKLIRYCNQWSDKHQDSIHDLGVYSFILEDIDDSNGS